MPYEELLGWLAYFERRPIEWRDDERAYKLLQAQGVKERPGAVFASLAKVYNKSVEPMEEGQINESFKGSFLYQKLLTSISGESIS